MALQTAIKWRLISVNPADGCAIPPAPQRESAALDQLGTSHLLEVSKDNWIGPLLCVAAGTGARRGELLALRWSEVDFTRGSITISRSLEQTKEYGLRVKETKGRKVRRAGISTDVLATLEEIRSVQQEYRTQFGTDYRSDLDLVFCHPDGSFIKPHAVTKAARRMAAKAGLNGVSLHTMRHSFGSQLLSAGVPLPAVSKLLGHANVAVTAEVYAHALPSDEAAAASLWQKTIDAARIELAKSSRKLTVINGRKSA